ncbi:MAG: preprotein translocase subunit YajC, partial [Gemmatimonadetes bacterium]|nr:preprotein translocase subunit YajC [Gemmatimonadota bacterium]NIY07504.1 preprotein translocase subunit YajC [Gemmatimonadota bacterium]
MNALPLWVLLQAGEGEGSPFSMLVPMALIFLIFYFLLIRPQQKRQKQQEAMLKAIEKGDHVVT